MFGPVVSGKYYHRPVFLNILFPCKRLLLSKHLTHGTTKHRKSKAFLASSISLENSGLFVMIRHAFIFINIVFQHFQQQLKLALIVTTVTLILGTGTITLSWVGG